MIYDAELFSASSINKKVKEGASPFLVSPKFQKRSALKFVGRTIPLAKQCGKYKRRAVCP
jgi:hypothetical protein